MDAKRPASGLSIGDVAARLGVSVRALRLYESHGLVATQRTEAGRRVFDAAALARLQQVLLLKKSGCTLARIGDLLARQTLDPAAVIDLQIDALLKQKTVLDRTLGSLRAARARVIEGAAVGLAEFCDIIKLGESAMTETAWQQVYERYFTEEDMQRWAAAKSTFSSADIAEAQRAWADLIARVEAAIAQGSRPDDDVSIELARAWLDVQKPLVEQVGIQIWNKGSQMYGEMDKWQNETIRAPFSQEVYRFISLAAEAGRAKGLIPARQSAA